MKVVSSFTLHHVAPNLYDSLSSVENILKNISTVFVHKMKVNVSCPKQYWSPLTFLKMKNECINALMNACLELMNACLE